MRNAGQSPYFQNKEKSGELGGHKKLQTRNISLKSSRKVSRKQAHKTGLNPKHSSSEPILSKFDRFHDNSHESEFGSFKTLKGSLPQCVHRAFPTYEKQNIHEDTSVTENQTYENSRERTLTVSSDISTQSTLSCLSATTNNDVLSNSKTDNVSDVSIDHFSRLHGSDGKPKTYGSQCVNCKSASGDTQNTNSRLPSAEAVCLSSAETTQDINKNRQSLNNVLYSEDAMYSLNSGLNGEQLTVEKNQRVTLIESSNVDCHLPDTPDSSSASSLYSDWTRKRELLLPGDSSHDPDASASEDVLLKLNSTNLISGDSRASDQVIKNSANDNSNSAISNAKCKQISEESTRRVSEDSCIDNTSGSKESLKSEETNGSRVSEDSGLVHSSAESLFRTEEQSCRTYLSDIKRSDYIKGRTRSLEEPGVKCSNRTALLESNYSGDTMRQSLASEHESRACVSLSEETKSRESIDGVTLSYSKNTSDLKCLLVSSESTETLVRDSSVISDGTVYPKKDVVNYVQSRSDSEVTDILAYQERRTASISPDSHVDSGYNSIDRVTHRDDLDEAISGSISGQGRQGQDDVAAKTITGSRKEVIDKLNEVRD